MTKFDIRDPRFRTGYVDFLPKVNGSDTTDKEGVERVGRRGGARRDKDKVYTIDDTQLKKLEVRRG